MSVATVPPVSADAASTSSSSRSRSISPHSILRPCSSVVAPSKDAAGNRSFGWLAAPPKELAAPRPAPIVVAELQPQAQQFNSAAANGHAGSPTHSSDEAESLASSAVPPLSPSASQDSMAESSTPSLPDTIDSTSQYNDGGSTPRSSAASAGVSPSPKIRFGALPERPPELRRRNSISLGVLARKNMLHAQGSYAGGGDCGPGGATRRVMMTDEEWEAYQAKFAQKNQTAAVDLGAVMKSGGRKLMGKLRRSGSNASTTSNSSTSSQSITAEQLAASGPSFQGSSVLGRARSGPSPSTCVAPKARDVVDVAPTLQEVDEDVHDQQHALGLTNGNANSNANGMGDETPRRGRSPSPTHHAPHQHHHFVRSPSPPPEVFHDEDEDDDCDSPKAVRVNGDVHPTDDAEYEHRMHHGSTSAALGFEMSNYHGRPAFGRRESANV